MLKKFRINGQKIIERGREIGIIKDVIFIKTSKLHAVALLADVYGEELEIPLSSIEIRDDGIVIPLINKEVIEQIVKSPEHGGLEPMSVRIKILPKAMRLLRSVEAQQKETTSTIILDVNDVLLSKCPICMGKVESMEEFVFCPSCLTPYHKSCLNELLKSAPDEKCWNCGDIALTRIIQLEK
jgi:hypothetical protein